MKPLPHPLDIRIICQHPPPSTWEGKAATFGLQDKSGDLAQGRTMPDGTLVFDCPMTISDDDPPRFSGTYVHGTPGDRFVYLSYRHTEDSAGWIKRIKVSLSSITAQAVKALKGDRSTALAVLVDGRKSARVDANWRLIQWDS